MRGFIGWGLLGILLRAFSNGFEAMGYAAPLAGHGVSGERLTFHLLALVLLIGTAYCGFRALRCLWRSIRGGPSAAANPEIRALADVFAGEREFDPDAALARYMATRNATPEPATSSQVRPAGGFGRKGG